MAAVDPRPVLGITLMVAMVALLLAVPLAVLSWGALRRSIVRMQRRATPVSSNSTPGWSEAARRAQTPSAHEIEQQFGDGPDGKS